MEVNENEGKTRLYRYRNAAVQYHAIHTLTAAALYKAKPDASYPFLMYTSPAPFSIKAPLFIKRLANSKAATEGYGMRHFRFHTRKKKALKNPNTGFHILNS